MHYVQVHVHVVAFPSTWLCVHNMQIILCSLSNTSLQYSTVGLKLYCDIHNNTRVSFFYEHSVIVVVECVLVWSVELKALFSLFRTIVTTVLGDLEFSFYHRWFDVIFLVSRDRKSEGERKEEMGGEVLSRKGETGIDKGEGVGGVWCCLFPCGTGQCSLQHRFPLPGPPTLT